MENPFTRFEERRFERDRERMRLNKRLAELNAEGDRDAVAVAQLRSVYPDGFPGSESRPVPDSVEAPSPAEIAEGRQRRIILSVKDMVLTVLKDAGPSGMTARQIKAKAFLKFGQQIKSNTLTVTLVRYSKPPAAVARCEGRTWFYIRPSVNGNGMHNAEKGKSPEVTGLL